MWFAYFQNNSGGVYREPAMRVVVEADSEEDALKVAKAAGVNERAKHCPCCGLRWHCTADNEWENKPTLEDLFFFWSAIPDPERRKRLSERAAREGTLLVLYVHKDGTREEV